jgi:hypothetical protein
MGKGGASDVLTNTLEIASMARLIDPKKLHTENYSASDK